MPRASRPTGWKVIPPPILLATPLILGLLLDRRVPLVRLSTTMATVLEWLGIALIVVGAAHTLSSVALFKRAGTTVIPHHNSSAFVTRGAYRWTRNPMYVGMTLIYLGVTAIAGALWPLIFLSPPLLVLNRQVIPMEERQLEQAFGPEYLAYKSRVRRWL